jgi:hypothetical protein
MDAKTIEKRFTELEKKVATLEDLQAIMKLQRTYGFYLEHWMYDDIIDLFSDRDDTKLNIMVGIFLGKEGIKRYFTGEKARFNDPELLHQIMQLGGVVDVAADGKTAAGRWFGFGAVALPTAKGVIQNLTGGVYTVEYIKEKGKWTIWKIMWNPEIMADTREGWIKKERLAAPGAAPADPPRPDKPRDIDTKYPCGYIPPFFYKHPVTGKQTTEKKHNAALKIKGVK